MGITKKGFTLIEILVAALVLTTVGVGIAGTYIIDKAMLSRASHRMQAINYAKNAAGLLQKYSEWVETDYGKTNYIYGGGSSYIPPYLGIGIHTKDTDPEICSLPESSFTQKLGATLAYNTKEIPVLDVKAILVEITVEWYETFPKKELVKENLFVVAFYFGGTDLISWRGDTSAAW